MAQISRLENDETYFFLCANNMEENFSAIFSGVLNSKSSIFLENLHSIIYPAIFYSWVSIEFGSKYVSQTLLRQPDRICLCMRNWSFLHAGLSYFTMYALCTVVKERGRKCIFVWSTFQKVASPRLSCETNKLSFVTWNTIVTHVKAGALHQTQSRAQAKIIWLVW